jgi:hypothetical protein
MLLLGPHMPLLHQVLQLIGLKANVACHYSWLLKYFASTKAASHVTQLISPTSFWHNIKDLTQLLISAMRSDQQ